MNHAGLAGKEKQEGNLLHRNFLLSASILSALQCIDIVIRLESGAYLAVLQCKRQD